MGVFIDPEELTDIQLLQVFIAYAYLLYLGCNMISDGAELLMLTPYSKLVGSCILPILGAVPDGAIVLFSGLGPDAQESLDVGVGALAGSTVMLLTIPWAMAICGGRVDLDAAGEPVYKARPRYTGAGPAGVSVGRGYGKVKTMALWMVVTAVPYVVVEAGALRAEAVAENLSLAESPWALAALLLSGFSFCYYLVAQYRAAYGGSKDGVLDALTADGANTARSRGAGLIAALQPHLDAGAGGDYEALNSGADAEKMRLLRGVLGPYFSKYDVDGSKTLEVSEMGRVFEDMNEPKPYSEVKALFAEYDRDASGTLTLDEFCAGMLKYASTKPTALPVAPAPTTVDEEDSEEEEYPDEYAEDKFKSVEEQQRAIRNTALKLCCFGTAVVLAFSDPITDVLNVVADRIGINPFYIGFVVAPIITNGSEVLASYTFALKKTQKSMVVAYEQLLGAAVMNNTYCLFVFLCIIYFRKLVWTYTAETAAILCAEAAMCVVALKLKIHTTTTAAVVFAIYPATLALVYVLENVFGLS
mmetsp:Transcript_26837/g.80484  ORF Transcript_26837/g.80484 Transcript_26837/m.80484 type:complete len:530 (+) Transcript_26837:155-1744(+)